MREDLIKFEEGVPVERQRELLTKRIAELEVKRAVQQSEIDKAREAYRRAQNKLSDASEKGSSLDDDIKKGVEQLITLLPGVQSDIAGVKGLYAFEGQETWGQINYRKEVKVVPADQAHLPQAAEETIRVGRDKTNG
jgi:hypothetical protein